MNSRQALPLSRGVKLSALIALSLFAFGCDNDDDKKNDPTAASACPPQDEACALLDADGDGVLNQADDFPLDARCSEISQEHCESCGTPARVVFSAT